jgi:glutamate carboxypeptidase
MDIQLLRDLAARRADRFVAELEQMVNVDCGSYTPEGVNLIAGLCEARMREHGWTVDRRVHEPTEGEPAIS